MLRNSLIYRFYCYVAPLSKKFTHKRFCVRGWNYFNTYEVCQQPSGIQLVVFDSFNPCQSIRSIHFNVLFQVASFRLKKKQKRNLTFEMTFEFEHDRSFANIQHVAAIPQLACHSIFFLRSMEMCFKEKLLKWNIIVEFEKISALGEFKKTIRRKVKFENFKWIRNYIDFP